jgi:hypothetical protein
MADETIERLLVKIETDLRGMKRGFDKAAQETRRGTGKMQKPLQKFTRQMDAEFKSLAAMSGRFGAALGTIGPIGAGVAVSLGAFALAVREVNQLSREAIDNFSNLANNADKLGISVESLQELRFASEQVGVSSQTLDLAFQRFTRRLGEAVQGGGELKGILEQYDIAVRNADGSTRSATDVMGDLAEAVQGAESEQEQLRIAFKAFDSEGAALVNLLRQGEEGLDAYAAAARKAGVVVDRDLVEKARAAGDVINRLQLEQQALRNQIGAQFVDWLVWMEEVKVNILRIVAEIGDSFGSREIGDMGLDALNRALATTETKLAAANQNLAAARARVDAAGNAIDRLTAQTWVDRYSDDVDGLKQRLVELIDAIGTAKLAAEDPAGGGGAPASLIPQASIDKATAEIAKLQGQIDNLRRTDLGRDTFASFSAAGVIDDEGNVKPGMEEQAEEITLLQRKIAEMERANEVSARATAITLALRTEQEKQADELAELAELWEAGAFTLEEYEAAQEAVREKYDDLGKAAQRVIEDIMTDQEKLAAEIEKLNELQREGKITTEQHGRAVEKAKQKYDDATDSLEEMAKQGVDGLADSFRDLANGTKDAGDVILDVLFKVGDALADVLAQKVSGSISGGGGGGGAGGFFGDVLGGIFGSSGGIGGGSGDFLSGLLGFADGGNPPVGVPSIVGERGPEIIVPRMPTTVIPNHAIGGMRGGGGGGGAGGIPVVINHNVTIDARGADPAQLRRVEGALVQMNKTFDDRAIGAVSQGVQRGRVSLS